ncbi:UNVERIFIED_CONTAM: Retrovirus-related Pol polyprotein from transposon RE2 [Sesamum angustifolium]|uniref:Retrovirus-related Pol polyprotein from transposon RE2 n=1 Tax=Sesamum angustifolium TaxID=2727405 RepID=A0AAW2Q933_9LAMI
MDFLLKHKSQVVHTLDKFFKMIQTQFETNVKTVRSNNGTEFVNLQCYTLFTSLGILHQTTCPYTPQQNGVVERKHKQLLDIAKALLFQAGLPKKFWATHRQKFDQQRAYKCIFLGYSLVKRAYKVFDIENNPLFDSRDIVFQEDTFPFLSTPINTESPSLPLPVPDIDSTIDIPYLPAPTSSSTPTPTNSLPVFSPNTNALRKSHRTVSKPASKDTHWVATMNLELQALEQNGTWELTSLPPDKRTIGSRWVFKLKLNPDGSIDRYKARLMAKSYNQIESVDYFDSFSPVALSVTVRVFLVVAASKSWPLFQLHVNIAFLHASRQWNLELTAKLLYFGFTQSPHDNCLFLKHDSGNFVALLVYVDDIILTGTSEVHLRNAKQYMDRLFTIKDLGPTKYFLGLELTHSPHGLLITQRKYLQDILVDVSMIDAKPTSTPFPPSIKLTDDAGSLLPAPDKFHRLVGRLLYLGFTRPDISFSVQQLSQFLQHPRTLHWDAALHVFRYLKSTSSLGLFFASNSPLHLSACSSVTWASCLDSRRSITRFCVFLGSSLVSWKTKKQATVSRSSVELEYRSMASTVCELLWLSYLLRNFCIPVQ